MKASLDHILSTRGESTISPRVIALLQQPLVEQLMTLTAQDDSALAPLATARDITVDGREITVQPSRRGSEEECVVAYGTMLLEVLEHTPTWRYRRLRAVAAQCAAGQLRTLAQVHLMLERNVNRVLFTLLLVVIITCLLVLFKP